MLPPRPPALVNGDFDPSQPLDDEDVETRSESDQPNYQMHATEINILIYLVSQLAMAAVSFCS